MSHAGRLELHRSRLLAAAVQQSAAKGARDLTVDDLVSASGVSRRVFYELFPNAQACVLAALEEALALASERARLGAAGKRRWAERIRGGLQAVLTLFDERPALGRLLVVESLTAGPASVGRRSEVVAQLAAVAEEGRSASRAKAPVLPSLTAEALVGAVLSVLHARLLANTGVASTGAPGTASLVALTSELMSVIVLPYLGPAAARAQLSRPVHAAPVPARRPREHLATERPLGELPIRLTYRTIRALLAVGAHPGASNRELAQATGVGDQGQMSKLLRRLESNDLIANDSPQGAHRARNAWTLTERGARLAAALSADRPLRTR